MQQENWQAPLFADASEILRKLKLNNFKLAVATSKSRLELNSALAFNKLADIFDITCCGEEYCHKPHPAMLEHIRSQFSLLPNQCIMIGDTITDINFAKNANIETIAVSFGAHTAEYLQTASPLAIIDKWTQLPELIDVLCTSNPVSYQ